MTNKLLTSNNVSLTVLIQLPDIEKRTSPLWISYHKQTKHIKENNLRTGFFRTKVGQPWTKRAGLIQEERQKTVE